MTKNYEDKELNRAFSCDIIVAMLEGKNNTFSLPWEIKIYFYAKLFHCFSPLTWLPWKPSRGHQEVSRDHKSPLNSSQDFFDSIQWRIELGWISQLVNFWFYAPNFAQVMVIQKLWVLYSLVCRRHLGVPLWNTNMTVTPPQTRTKVDLSICLTLCDFKCLWVSLLKVSRQKYSNSHNLDFN